MGECQELKNTINSLQQLLKQKEEEFKADLQHVQQKYKEEQERCTKLRTELRESHNLLLLVDLSSNLRLQAWQSKKIGAEQTVGSAKSKILKDDLVVDDGVSSVLSSEVGEADDQATQSSIDDADKTMDERGF